MKICIYLRLSHICFFLFFVIFYFQVVIFNSRRLIYILGRSFPNCGVWYYYNSFCYFYSSFNNFTTTNVDTYVGKSTGSMFWSCIEESGKYYFDSSLNWSRQIFSSSTFNRAGCCQDCFWSRGTVLGCQSYMYNEISRDCYHSAKNFSITVSVSYDGMFTGAAILNLN